MEKANEEDLRARLLAIRKLVGEDVIIGLFVSKNTIQFVDVTVRPINNDDEPGELDYTTFPKATKLSKIMRYLG